MFTNKVIFFKTLDWNLYDLTEADQKMLKLTIKKDLETIQNSSSIQTNVLSDQEVEQIKNLSLKCFIDPNMKSNDNLTMGKLTWIYSEKELRF